ncbi:proteasome subunit beta type-7 [Drosophila ficusphila]|uniref:proteasome subunit beta type-7 n=1 Tax=Drosophila ficusphila TaxID=30025 RepID=UPI0007E79748|nr:proteasome subunit beta type-7 [Drosophila ficusphila]
MFSEIPTMMKCAARSPFQCGPSGFSFDNCLRNKGLIEKGISVPNCASTGTTIVGITYDEGVIIGADSRATNENIIPSNSSRKIYELQNNIFAGGAGVARDTSALMEMTHAQLELHRMNTGFRQVPVCCANHMVRQVLFRFNGNMEANVILGGVDSTGCYLYCTRSDGTTFPVPFASLGSGNLAAMSVLESRWTEELDEESAVALVCDAVSVGVDNDLKSGGNVSLCIIRVDFSVHWDVQSPIRSPPTRTFPLVVKPGCTSILSCVEHRVVLWGKAPGPEPDRQPDPRSNRGEADERGRRRREPETFAPPRAKRRKFD